MFDSNAFSLFQLYIRLTLRITSVLENHWLYLRLGTRYSLSIPDTFELDRLGRS